MVSIRRRRLLGLCSGVQNKASSESAKPAIAARPLSPLNDAKELTVQDINLTTLGDGSNNSAKEDHTFVRHHSPEVKRRKRHRRKQVENQEPCVMRGVYYKNMKWQAAIKVDKKQIHLGTVGSQEEAARLYDRAAFKCGREPNFELTEEEKNELRKISWEEFLAMTRATISNKKNGRKSRSGPHKKAQENDSEPNNGSSASDDDTMLLF